MDFLRSIFTRIRSWFTGIWEKTEKRDRTRFLVISIVALTLIVGAFILLGSGSYVEVSESLRGSPEAIAAAQATLEENSIPYRMDGDRLMVHKNDIYNASGALTISTSMPFMPDFSIYERGSGLSGTDADRELYRTYMLSDSIRQALEGMSFVDSATVILNIADNSNSFFASEILISTAAVTLVLNTELERSQVDALVSHVANAAGIDPLNVSFTDQNGRKLNRLTESDEGDVMDRRRAYRDGLESDIESGLYTQLHKLFPAGHVGVMATAGLNYDEHSIETTTFTPVVDTEGIARSIQTLDEIADGTGAYGGEPGTDENGLGEDYPEVDDLVNHYEQHQETINYEINESYETIVREQGYLESLTVAVTIDSNVLGEDQQATDAMIDLVARSVGIRPAQQETDVVVQYHPFLGLEAEELERSEYEAWLRRQELFELIKLLALYILVGVCVIVLIWRTFAFLKPKPVEVAEQEDFTLGNIEDYSELLEAAEASQELEVTKTPSRERIEQFVESNPEAVANMLRTWLSDEGERGW
ncbi:MAG: hypothetical protein LBR72_01085 [Oscillospiraceae bacterium]|jgi:flagellar M-ring protein FliF|nr:hypothetical protein [Oscillospiraceae bacterium]